MEALVGAFNQEKALVGAFSVIVQPVVEPMDSFTALVSNGGNVHNIQAAQLPPGIIDTFTAPPLTCAALVPTQTQLTPITLTMCSLNLSTIGNNSK